MKHTAAFMSEREDWETPQAFFDHFDRIYNFTLDAAAFPHNAKCDRYYTAEDDALTQRWDGVVWCNPPYSNLMGKWVHKAYREAKKGSTVVMLIPARTDTAWFHEYVMHATLVVLVRGRLKFGGSDNSAPFPSMVVVFTPHHDGPPAFTTMRRIHDEPDTGQSVLPLEIA